MWDLAEIDLLLATLLFRLYLYGMPGNFFVWLTQFCILLLVFGSGVFAEFFFKGFQELNVLKYIKHFKTYLESSL